ncbi:hypothetical protein [Halorussus lipolyticus]|uniref:hypothetical protein n=1 Tax=Halorussus lipolyticus TaxID=3034024 RepID=UPI0023E76C88|nr:hypothetical protein [Halorussus sp. DT80]
MKGNSRSRRNILRTFGAGIASTGFAGSALGAAKKEVQKKRKDSFDKAFEQARQIREKTGSQEKFVRFLTSQGFKVAREDRTFQMPTGEKGGDVSTQDFQKSELSTSMTLTEGCDSDYMYVDYHVDIDADETSGPVGANGPDDITLSWDEDHFRVVDYRWYCSADNGSIKTTALNGLDWEYKDREACPIGCDVSWACGGKLKKKVTDQERAVRGVYHHTWNDTEFKGFGVSSGGGVVWNFAPSEYGWEGKYETHEESSAVNNPDRCDGPT